jgi:hypothetical protein
MEVQNYAQNRSKMCQTIDKNTLKMLNVHRSFFKRFFTFLMALLHGDDLQPGHDFFGKEIQETLKSV